MKLSKTALKRYDRQIVVPEIGLAGQQKLAEAKVLIIGAGGLGAAVGFYLGAAGGGTIGLVDCDKVELSNLQRQIWHFTTDLGKPKVNSAKSKLKRLNPELKIKTYLEKVTAKNIKKIITDYDIILDCTDNFETKFVINDGCVALEKPFVHAGVNRFVGQALTYLPGAACYRCLFGGPPERSAVDPAKLGIVGSVAGTLGTIQATEAIKYIVGQGELLTNKLLTVDLLTLEFRKINIKKDPECGACKNAK